VVLIIVAAGAEHCRASLFLPKRMVFPHFQKLLRAMRRFWQNDRQDVFCIGTRYLSVETVGSSKNRPSQSCCISTVGGNTRLRKDNTHFRSDTTAGRQCTPAGKQCMLRTSEADAKTPISTTSTPEMEQAVNSGNA
jgi:hypothetical protein